MEVRYMYIYGLYVGFFFSLTFEIDWLYLYVFKQRMSVFDSNNFLGFKKIFFSYILLIAGYIVSYFLRDVHITFIVIYELSIWWFELI